MTDASEWRGRVGEAWAEEWRRTDRSLAPVQAALLDTLVPRLCASAEVLDIGCGAGSTSLALADARPDARVTGLDLSEALVAAARERAAGRAGFEVGDASTWTRPDARRFDALVSRHGVMFFDDPAAAFAHLADIAAPPEGRLPVDVDLHGEPPRRGQGLEQLAVPGEGLLGASGQGQGWNRYAT